MVARIEIINRSATDADINVFLDATNARGIAVASYRLAMPGNQRSNTARIAEAGTEVLQQQLDVRTLLTDLALDDPARTVDPGRPDYFWARSALSLAGVAVYRPTALVGGTATHLIGRESLVEVYWTGTEYSLRQWSPPDRLR